MKEKIVSKNIKNIFEYWKEQPEIKLSSPKAIRKYNVVVIASNCFPKIFTNKS